MDHKPSDQKTSVDDVKKWVKKFCDDRGWDDPHNAKDCAIGLITESAELLEIFRFVPREKEAEVLREQREHIGEELADSLYFILRFAERFGFDLSDCLSRKLEKNATKYPAGRK